MTANWSLHESRKIFFDNIDPSCEGMLQTENAEVLGEIDTKEILAYLPPYQGKKILDLGAGIGRFTSKLAEVALHVTAVDINQRFIIQNKNNNRNMANIAYICNDVTEVDFPAGSFDLVFSSWILKYLGDDEIYQLLSRALRWLTPGGYFFFRESCFYQLGTISRDGNPTIFRPIAKYCELLHSVAVSNIKFKLKKGKNVQSYLQFQSAPNQVCFLARRVEGDLDSDLARLLQTRFSLENIVKLEKVFGCPWVNVGGKHKAKEFSSRLEMQPNQRVLIIGCGTGASAFMMAKELGVYVLGVDISIPSVNLAVERQLKLDVDHKKRELGKRMQWTGADGEG